MPKGLGYKRVPSWVSCCPVPALRHSQRESSLGPFLCRLPCVLRNFKVALYYIRRGPLLVWSTVKRADVVASSGVEGGWWQERASIEVSIGSYFYVVNFRGNFTHSGQVHFQQRTWET